MKVLTNLNTTDTKNLKAVFVTAFFVSKLDKFYKTIPGFKFYSPTSRHFKFVLGSKLNKPFGFRASACRHGEFIERTGSKTIANVRTIDECVKRMNGVFSLENTESEYKVLFASNACIKMQLWFKVL